MRIKNNLNVNYYYKPPTSLGGGESKKRSNKSSILSLANKSIKPHRMDGEVMGELGYELKNLIEQNPFKVVPSQYQTFPELLNRVLKYAKDELYRSKDTIDHYDRYARLMSSRDQPFPIDFFNLNFGQYKYHMHWYKEHHYDRITGKNFYGLKHRKDVVDTFLLAYGYPKGTFPYKLPPQPRSKTPKIPSPDIAHDIINYDKFHKDGKINKHMQFLFAFGFWVGPRVPSEYCRIKLEDLYFDEGYIIIHESKKYGSERQVFLENAILKGKTRKSLKNYIDYVRPSFESQYSGNSLFISPSNGKPYSIRYLGKILSQQGKMIFPEFRPYCMRDWCAIARLIQRWLEKHHDPLGSVSDFMGHEEQKTTEKHYLRNAENYFRLYPFDWIKRTLKFDNKVKEESALKSKQRQKTLVSNGTTGKTENGPAEI